MNKKGEGMLLQLVISLVVWFGGVLAIPLMMDVIDGARTGLQCATPSLISDGTKILCLFTDLGVILIIWTALLIIVNIILGNKK